MLFAAVFLTITSLWHLFFYLFFYFIALFLLANCSGIKSVLRNGDTCYQKSLISLRKQASILFDRISDNSFVPELLPQL